MRTFLFLPFLLHTALASFGTLPDDVKGGAGDDETSTSGTGGGASVPADDGTKTIRDLIVNDENLSEFRAFMDATGLLEGILDEEGKRLTVFAPTNEAMLENGHMELFKNGMDENPPRWNDNMVAAGNNHIIDGQVFKKSQIFDMSLTEIDSLHDTLVVSQWSEQVGQASIIQEDIPAINGVLHIVNRVIKPEFFDNSFAKLELQSEFGPDLKDRISMVDVVDLVGGRQTLQTVRESGMTYAGCRIRAFNRMGLDDNYLWQTLNGGKFVKEDELMNPNFTQQTLNNFVEYQMVPKNYYSDQIPNNFIELVTPMADCGHMWVTKRNNKLCFNDGCVVFTPDERKFLASNGVGYVLDRCPICPGVSMLANYAAEYTHFSMYDVSQLFIGSEWNMRNLSLSVGDGSPVTMFAAVNTAFDQWFTLEDTTRLSTDKWRRHLWDLLKHFLIQGAHSKEDLKNMVLANDGKPVNLTMLTGENTLLEYDADRNMLVLEGGDIFMGDIRGVDGLLHFTTAVPRPISVTHTTYTIARDDPRFNTHIKYINSVFLDEDINQLLPLTTFYAPNEAFEGKLFDIMEMSDVLLENHVFKELLWCEKLRELAAKDERIESHNGRTWKISVNEEGFPCFDTIRYIGDFAEKACITKCDILVRNGIAHELDTILVYETVDTIAPRSPGSSGGSQGSSGSTPTFSRPKNNGENGYGSDQQSGATALFASAGSFMGFLASALLAWLL